MPSQSFSHGALSKASAEEVWRALDLPGTWEAIPGIDRVVDPVLEGGRLRGFSFDTVAGSRHHRGVATPAGREEGRSVAWHIESTEVRGIVAVVLEPNEVGTWVEVSLDVESVGFVASLFFPVVAGAIGRGLPEAVEGFAQSIG